jgi:hypothetical protein
MQNQLLIWGAAYSFSSEADQSLVTIKSRQKRPLERKNGKSQSKTC